MSILILSAFSDEIIKLQQTLELKKLRKNNINYMESSYNGELVFLAITGIGTTRASVATTILCQELQPDIILFMGTAGGLLPEQHTGDILIGSEIIDIDLIELPNVLKNTPYDPCLMEPHEEEYLRLSHQLNPSLLEYFLSLNFPKVFPGVIATSNTFPTPKNALDTMKNFKSAAIEMEGSGVCCAAKYYNIPAVIIRAISNNIDSDGNDLGAPDGALAQCATRLADFITTVLNNLQLLKINLDTRVNKENSKETRNIIFEVKKKIQSYHFSNPPQSPPT